MNYWWVNQKQTHSQEIGEGDGYMWSPKKQSNHKAHFSYEFMRQVNQGDIVFSYAKSAIIAIGVVQTHCYSFPKPTEFGNAGSNWSNEGWKVDVKYRKLNSPLRTIEKINDLRRHLPSRLSPIRPENGHGNQAYLFKIDYTFAMALAQMIDTTTVNLVSQQFVESPKGADSTIDKHIRHWEDQVQTHIENDQSINTRVKETLIKARIGQGRFRKNVLQLEPHCRITGVDRTEHLIASHIKPWRSSDNIEKVDPENGLMLTPTIDHLFDKGFISFEQNGSLVLSDVASRDTLKKLGVIDRDESVRIPQVSNRKKDYVEWHRENMLL